jgi:hypothetical protein
VVKKSACVTSGSCGVSQSRRPRFRSRVASIGLQLPLFCDLFDQVLYTSSSPVMWYRQYLFETGHHISSDSKSQHHPRLNEAGGQTRWVESTGGIHTITLCRRFEVPDLSLPTPKLRGNIMWTVSGLSKSELPCRWTCYYCCIHS